MLAALYQGRSTGDPDAVAWAAAVTGNGGTYSAAGLAAVSAFAAAAKASGYWTKLNRINLFAGGGGSAAQNFAGCLVPLKVGGGSATETNVNFVAGDYTEATGLTGNGSTKYLNTGLNVATTLTLSDTHIGVYNRSAAVGGAAYSGANDATNFLVLAAPTSDGTVVTFQGTAAGASLASTAIAAPYGHIVATRTASNAQAIYRNGSSIASNAAAAAALPSQNFTVFARSGNGAPTDFSSQIFAGYHIGSGFTAGDAAAMNTHMQAFQAALGRNV